jgi:hypothetical protein
LLVDFIDQVNQAIQVLAGMSNSSLGFAAALLVFGYTRGFFEINPQFVRLRIDDPANHALLDNRVTARPQAGAEKDISDITTTTAGVIEEIPGLADPGCKALNRNFIILGVLARDPAIRIIENQFNRGLAYRLPTRRAAEDHVFHRLATQVPSRGFTHNPAYRIDNI